MRNRSDLFNTNLFNMFPKGSPKNRAKARNFPAALAAVIAKAARAAVMAKAARAAATAKAARAAATAKAAMPAGVAVAAAIVVSAGLAGSLPCTAEAAGSDYTYTVTLSGGNQGTIASAGAAYTTGTGAEISLKNGKLTITGLQYGDQVNFGNVQGNVTLKDSGKYYVRGVRGSGRDNSEIDSSVFTVEGDADYVVGYGIAGGMVAYTVEYEDEDGNALAKSQTYYGAPGDKPVLAYLYIDGYQPQAYNLTKTLGTNEADNVFTFVYSAVETGTTAAATQQAEGGNAAATGAANANAAANAGAADAGAADAGAADAGAADAGAADAGAAANTAVTAPDEEVPQDLVDLDDEEVPEANLDVEDGTTRERSAFPIALGIGIALAAAAALVGGFVYYRKKLAKKKVVNNQKKPAEKAE